MPTDDGVRYAPYLHNLAQIEKTRRSCTNVLQAEVAEELGKLWILD